jgi:hypothetical protein
VSDLQPIDDSTLALLKFDRFEVLFDNTGDSQSAAIRLKSFEVRRSLVLVSFVVAR